MVQRFAARLHNALAVDSIERCLQQLFKIEPRVIAYSGDFEFAGSGSLCWSLPFPRRHPRWRD